jgi:hypothetical protein
MYLLKERSEKREGSEKQKEFWGVHDTLYPSHVDLSVYLVNNVNVTGSSSFSHTVSILNYVTIWCQTSPRKLTRDTVLARNPGIPLDINNR